METLESKRLILRSWKQEDYKDLYEYGKSDLVGPDAGWPVHKSEEESKLMIDRFIREKEFYAIVLKGKDKVIGSIGIHNRRPDKTILTDRQREIGYVINPSYWGKGYASEAVETVLYYCFHRLDLDLVWFGHFDYNEKSKNVIKKSGAKYKFYKDQVIRILDHKPVRTMYYVLDRDIYIESRN